MRASRRVFVLGSGFSASMGLPTLPSLFSELMTHPGRAGYSDHDDVRYALQQLYPHFVNEPATISSYPPFEEFLSLITVATRLQFFDEDYWEQKRRAALRLLTDCLASKCSGAEDFPLLAQFIDRLSEGDTVVTFNWDNLIERALQRSSRQVNLLSRDSTGIALLKLHGSLNWVRIPEGVSLQDPTGVIEVAGRVVRTKDFTYYNVWDRLDQPPFIVPPVSVKRALEDKLLRELWHEAFNAIIDAGSVTFIGYSIPADDLEARTLLTSAWTARRFKMGAAARYLLVDPNPAVCGRYAALIGTNFDYIQARFGVELLDRLFS